MTSTRRFAGHVVVRFPNVTFERSDDFTQTGHITDQIIAALKTADLIIAVITEQNARTET